MNSAPLNKLKDSISICFCLLWFVFCFCLSLSTFPSERVELKVYNIIKTTTKKRVEINDSPQSRDQAGTDWQTRVHYQWPCPGLGFWPWVSLLVPCSYVPCCLPSTRHTVVFVVCDHLHSQSWIFLLQDHIQGKGLWIDEAQPHQTQLIKKSNEEERRIN